MPLPPHPAEADGDDRPQPEALACQTYRAALARRSAGRSTAVQAALRPRPPAGWASGPPNPVPCALPPSPLAALLRHVDDSAALLSTTDPALEGSAGAGTPGSASLPGSSAHRELRALRQAGVAWAQLRVQQQVQQSLAQAPEQAGPLNSHGLVLRTLQTLQTLSPAYLLRFMAQMDTLFVLDRLQTPPAAQGHRGASAQRSPRRPARG